MKVIKVFLFGVLFSTVVFLGSASVSYAVEHEKQDIQMLNDAAAALKTSNPKLSKSLVKQAKIEAKEEATGKEIGEKNEGGKIKLLFDSAAALKTSNSRLADALTKYAKEESKEEAQEEKEEKK